MRVGVLLQARRSQNKRKLKTLSTVGIGYCKFCKHNTDSHEDMKWRVFKELARQGCEVVTEAKFKDGGVADLFCLDTGWVFEILESEEIRECREKVGVYPVGRVFFIKNGFVYDSESDYLLGRPVAEFFKEGKL